MYTDVDELGGDVWFGEVPAGPDGEPMPSTRLGKEDAVLRRMRQESVCMPIGAATAAAATATESPAKKTEDEARDTREMQKADRKDSGLPDSGAGATMLTKATGAVWSPANWYISAWATTRS